MYLCMPHLGVRVNDITRLVAREWVLVVQVPVEEGILTARKVHYFAKRNNNMSPQQVYHTHTMTLHS